MFFCELEKEEFQAFISQHPLNDFIQDPRMEEIGKLNGIQSCFVGVKQNGKILAACRIMLQKGKFGYHCYAPRGPILDYQQTDVLAFFIQELKKYLKKKKGYVLVIDPKVLYKERDVNGNLVENGFDNSQVIDELIALGFEHQGFETGMDTSKQVRWVFVLPLENKTKEEVWKGMDANTRNLIRKAEKNGVKIKEITKQELGLFKEITENTSERRHFHDRTFAYYQKMYELFAPRDEVKFLIATLSLKDYIAALEEEKKEEEQKLVQLKAPNKITTCKELIQSLQKKQDEAKKMLEEEKKEELVLAASMFMTYGNEVIYLFCGNIEKYMKLNAQYLIQWYMIQYAIEHGFPQYNFYGISGIFDKKDKDYGIYEFKKKFNGRVEEYIGRFVLPLSPLYRIKKMLKK